MIELSSQGKVSLRKLKKQLKSDEPACEACVSGWGWGRWREDNHITDFKSMPIKTATCIVWQPDTRVMIDLSHLELSCDYHTDFSPYPKFIDYGKGPRLNVDNDRFNHGLVHVRREVVYRPRKSG